MKETRQNVNKEQVQDSTGTPLPPLEVRSPSPDFGDDSQGERIRAANREAEAKRKKRNRRIGVITAATAVVSSVPLAITGYAVLKTKEAADGTRPQPGVSGPEVPGIQPEASADITVNSKRELDAYTLDVDKNPDQVLLGQDKVVNDVIARLSDDPSYDYTAELSHIATPEAADDIAAIVETVSSEFNAARKELLDKGVDRAAIEEVTVMVQTLTEGEPVLGSGGYEQAAVMSYWLRDGEGYDARLVENDYAVTYTYTSETVGLKDGEQEPKPVYRVSGFLGNY